jgi:hypothetical protein
VLVGVVPLMVAGAQEDDGSQAEHSAGEVFWLAEEADSRFVTRSGEELEFGDDDQFVLELTADLSGRNELDSETLEPDAGDPDGTGDATISLREDGSVCWELHVTNITLPTIAAHIHEGAADVNGPVVVPLGGPDTTGVSIGCVTADVALVEAIASNPAGYYVNVHTMDFPAGAVRGQLEGGFGPMPGDQFFLTEDLFASDAAGTKGDRIGHTVIQCTFGIAETLQCGGTAFLDGRGQVHVTATVPFTEDEEEPAPFDVALVGGTGEFATFGGDATLTDQESDEGPSTTLYAVRLRDLAR